MPGAKLEVVAAEPQIADPVAFDWGPDGKLWVVEMSDYPNGGTWHGPGDEKDVAGGRVKVLEDKDGDGRLSQTEFISVMKDRLHRGFKVVTLVLTSLFVLTSHVRAFIVFVAFQSNMLPPSARESFILCIKRNLAEAKLSST